MKDHTIPSCSIGNADNEWTICFSEGNFDVSYFPEEKRIDYRNNDLMHSEWDILHLTRQTLDRQLQEKGNVAFHSASLRYRGRGVMFFGGSGSGKSSIVLSAYGEGNFDYISNETTVVDSEQNIVAGTNLLVLKKNALLRFFPDLAEKGKGPTPGIRILYGEELFGERIAKLPTPLSLVVNPSLRETTFSYKPGKNITKELLFQECSTYIAGNYLLNGVNNAGAPNLDTLECREKRANLVRSIVENCEILSIEGQSDKILRIVREELKK